MNKREWIGGLPVDGITGPDIIRTVSGWLEKPVRPRQIVTLNVNMLMTAFRNPTLYQVIANADLVTPDGYGIAKALQKRRCFIQPVPGVNLVRELLIDAARRGFSVFFYGGRPPVCRRLSTVVKGAFPGLRVQAIRDGYGCGCPEQSVIGELLANPPDLLFVGLGTPAQEFFIHNLLPNWRKTVGVGIGGALDVLAGTRVEAPGFMRHNGFEWLFRMIQDPRRLNRLPDLARFWLKYLR